MSNEFESSPSQSANLDIRSEFLSKLEGYQLKWTGLNFLENFYDLPFSDKLRAAQEHIFNHLYEIERREIAKFLQTLTDDEVQQFAHVANAPDPDFNQDQTEVQPVISYEEV
jgi:hypothetical protein